MSKEVFCGRVEVDQSCEIVDSDLCYWLSHKVGCDRCYIHTMKTADQKFEARDRWAVTQSLLPDVDSLHESEDCQFCKGEIEKKDGYAFVEMAHPDPPFSKGIILGLGKKVRMPVGSLVSVQAGVCKRCRKAFRMADLIAILTPVLAVALGIGLLMLPQIGPPMAALFPLLPVIFVALLGAAGYFLGVNLTTRHMKKARETVKVDVSEIPVINQMLHNGWFFFQASGGAPRVSFSKEKQHCRIKPDAEFLKERAEKWGDAGQERRAEGEERPQASPTLKEAYRTLGVEEGADMEEVKKKFRALSMEFHPDRHKDHKAQYEDLYKKILDAYDLILQSRKD